MKGYGKPKQMFTAECPICFKKFKTRYQNQRVCSFECKMENNRQRSRSIMRRERHPAVTKLKGKELKINPKCVVCGWNLTIDLHHERRLAAPLCPNHHSLITRNIAADIEDIKLRNL